MPCFHPLHGYKSKKNGAWISEANAPLKHTLEPLTIPCSKCTGCRAEYSRQWAMRILHEHQHTNERSSFITLTYNDTHLPQLGTLIKKDFQDFMKRLREPNVKLNWYPDKIRFYHCGEYGENFGRPHYHAILFNCVFTDLRPLPKKPRKEQLYTSLTLEKIWGKGHVSIGKVTFESAAYVAAYVQKKINGPMKKEHYEIRYDWSPIDKQTGEQQKIQNKFGKEKEQKQQEYATMSRKPGIAGLWFAKHKKDVYPSDNIHIKGRAMRPPKYYDRLYELDNPETMEEIKKNRLEEMEKTAHKRTKEALQQAELTHKARMSLYKRNTL